MVTETKVYSLMMFNDMIKNNIIIGDGIYDVQKISFGHNIDLKL